MGMYDYVEVDEAHGLPVIQFQTKDFDCELEPIRITKEGRLEIEAGRYESVPKAERPYPHDDGIMGMAGSISKVDKRWEDMNFHGVFVFYGTDGPDFENDWHEYEAKFTNGSLVAIERITPPQPNPIKQEE